MMQKTLREIAELVGGTVEGDGDVVIRGISGLKEAGAGDLTFVASSKYYPLIGKTGASALIMPPGVASGGKPVIRNDNPSWAFAKVATLIAGDNTRRFQGVHKTAIIEDGARLGKDVSIGPYAVVSGEAVIGDRTVIYSGCFIGEGARIGRDGLLYPNVTVREKVVVGDRCIVHSGTVIGADGFGFVDIEGVQEKIPQIGTVEIGNDVEIGANVTIDRARFDKTVIGDGTKIDNLVQIAHNVRIGKNCLIVSQAGISGSVTLEDRVIIAGQGGLVGHITIGAGTVIMAKSGVSHSLPPGSLVFGYPAKPHDQARKVNACVQRLPYYVEEIRELKKKVEDLEKKVRKA